MDGLGQFIGKMTEQAMRYFFHLINGHGRQEDKVGQELSDRSKVELEVSRILTDVARDELPHCHDGRILVEVRTEEGKQIYNGSIVFKTNWLETS